MNVRVVAIGLAGAAVAALVVIAAIESWSPEAWTALAAWLTTAVAVAAGVVALGQLGEARRARLEQARLRKEQAQPYVVVFMEFSEASTFLVDLVVRNFGATAAHDVHLDIHPVPRRSIDETRRKDSDTDEHRNAGDQAKETQQSAGDQPEPSVWLPDRLPVLVPGQEWKTLWDTGRRMDTNLPDYHAATIRYRDSQGESYAVETVLDWRFVKEREMVTVYGAHQAAKALQDMSKAIANWREAPAGGLAVYVRDGDAKDEGARRRREALLTERQARAVAEEAKPPFE